ncbi:hypothetical protein BJ912DRAFT_924480, partial [Pholiota molesta]
SVDGQLVIKDIIPAISRMRNKYRITFSTMFNQPLLKSQNTLPTVEFGDFARSDMFFNQMIFDDFEMFPPAVLPAPSEVICINTAFDPKDDKNIKVDYRTGKARDRYFATQKQRKPAQAAEAAISIEDLQAKLKQLLASGYRESKKYIHIPANIINKRLCINDVNDQPMIIVIPDMPTELKEKAMRYLTAAYPENLVETDTWSAKHQHTFESVHFSWYNRYSKRGDKVPIDIEPAAHQRAGSSKQVKTAQCVPRTSKELQTHSTQYKLLEESFEDIFEWLATAVKQLIPDEYDAIAQFADVLPAGAFLQPTPLADLS